MKQDAALVNVARAEIIYENALIAAPAAASCAA
jgi:phosphoglycerate dehydrogenase-like enzyme